MPDGSRKRRFAANKAKREWYAFDRARRFRNRFGLSQDDRPHEEHK